MRAKRLAHIAVDEEGFLLDPTDWDRDLACDIAAQEDIDLNPDHWAIIDFIRDFFEQRQSVPEARVLLKHLREKHGNKANRKYIHTLFPYGYGQQACKIAGMRKPRKLMLDV